MKHYKRVLKISGMSDYLVNSTYDEDLTVNEKLSYNNVQENLNILNDLDSVMFKTKQGK